MNVLQIKVSMLCSDKWGWAVTTSILLSDILLFDFIALIKPFAAVLLSHYNKTYLLYIVFESVCFIYSPVDLICLMHPKALAFFSLFFFMSFVLSFSFSSGEFDRQPGTRSRSHTGRPGSFWKKVAEDVTLSGMELTSISSCIYPLLSVRRWHKYRHTYVQSQPYRKTTTSNKCAIFEPRWKSVRFCLALMALYSSWSINWCNLISEQEQSEDIALRCRTVPFGCCAAISSIKAALNGDRSTSTFRPEVMSFCSVCSDFRLGLHLSNIPSPNTVSCRI